MKHSQQKTHKVPTPKAWENGQVFKDFQDIKPQLWKWKKNYAIIKFEHAKEKTGYFLLMPVQNTMQLIEH